MMTLLRDIWRSFQSLPLWVKLWMAFGLGPVNFGAFFFWHAPYGAVVAILGSFGLLVNFGLVSVERGFSRATAIPHLVFWIPLMGVLGGLALPLAEGAYLKFLYILGAVNFISILFDVREAYLWGRGDRAVAGRRP